MAKKKDYSFEESRRVWNGGFRGYKPFMDGIIPSKGKTVAEVTAYLATCEARGLYVKLRK